MTLSSSPLFTVVSVTYQNLDGLGRTAQSLRAQDQDDYEWYVIDGGSSDGTVEYLETEPLGPERSHKTRWVSEPDGGIYHAMQKGLRKAEGGFICFMNAGDIFAGPQVLTEVAAALDGSSIDILYGDALEAGDGVSVYKTARPREANSYAMLTHHQAIFYRTELARRIGFDLSYRWTADWVFTERALRAADGRIRHLARPLCVFERGGVSQRSDHRREIDSELMRIYRHEMGHSLFKAAAFWAAKVGANGLRARAPVLYDWLRYRASAKAAA